MLSAAVCCRQRAFSLEFNHKPLFSSLLLGYLGTAGPWLDFCARLHCCRCRHHARVLEEEIWRTKDSNLHVCALPHSLYIHQDISTYPMGKQLLL